jgi:monoamine oxidase
VQSLIEAIAATLPPETVQNNKRVTSIHQEGNGTITLETDCQRDRIRANAVIITLPPRIVARNISFYPNLSPDLMASMVNKPTWMAAQAKVIAVYEHPFWREKGLSGHVSSWVGPLQEIHDASPDTGAGALFGFFGMAAKSRQKLGEEKVLKLVVEQLMRLFGSSAENMSALLYKDWSSDPETAVDEDAEPLRDYPVYGTIVGTESWRKKIIFAGTETVYEQGGHLEGALRSAERAVSELIKL